MAKDTYTYKNILLGLRKEFLSANEILDELKIYSISNKQYVKDYYYYLMKYITNEIPELMVSAKINHSDFINFINNLRRKISGYEDIESSMMVRNNRGIYYPLSHDRIKLGVDPLQTDLFKAKAEEILSSDFARYMNFNSITTLNGINMSDIFIRFYKLYLRVALDSTLSQMVYLGRFDKLEFNGYNKNILTEEHLKCLLSQEFPKEHFSSYHQEIIDTHLSDEVEILLPDDYTPSSIDTFEIEDNKDELILRRVAR